MKKKRLFLFYSYCSVFFTSSGQVDDKVTVNEKGLVKLPFSEYVLGEPHLSINPNDENHLLLGAMMWSTEPAGKIITISAVSFNGGKNWNHHRFPDKNTADPWTIITPGGEAVFTFLGRKEMWTYRSKDGGLTWTDSLSHGTHHDHQTMTFMVDEVNRTKDIYLLSAQAKRNENGLVRDNIYLARSTDGGKSFPQKTYLSINNLLKNTMTPVVLSDGTLIVSYSEYAYKTLDNSQSRLPKNNSWTIYSKDKGKTFSEPRFITQEARGFPVLTLDKSSRFKDRLYWVTNSKNGEHIYSFYSIDKGESWSKPIMVSKPSRKKTIPNIEVNNDGIVGVTWYEKEEEDFCQNFYFAFSEDGGQNFSEPIKISQETSCADPEKNAGALRGGWSSGGHYTGLVTKPDGSFQMVWADARSGRYQLYFSEVQFKINSQK